MHILPFNADENGLSLSKTVSKVEILNRLGERTKRKTRKKKRKCVREVKGSNNDVVSYHCR